MGAIVRLEPGIVFATDFRIVSSLSEGGMGTVYIADQISTGARRALKLMHPQMVADEKLRRRFEQEARISARIESDHVVQVVAAGIDGSSGTPWLAMELLNGADLADHVEKTGPVAPAMLLSIFEQLCHALGAAHRINVVHRDLKPENLFLAKARSSGSAFTLKVLDFGIAKIAAETTASHTAAVGTPMWMAPEQTSPGEAIGPQTDIWALGLLAFWLLTGRIFWRVANEESPGMAMILREVIINPIPAASARAAELGSKVTLGAGFDEWFARCVNRDFRARFATVEEAYRVLELALSADSVDGPVAAAVSAPSWSPSTSTGAAGVYRAKHTMATTVPVTTPPAPEKPRTRVRRGVRIAALGASAIAAGLIALVIQSRGSQHASPAPSTINAPSLATQSVTEGPAGTPTPVMLDPLFAGSGRAADKGAPSSVPPIESASPVETRPDTTRPDTTRPDTISEPAASSRNSSSRSPKPPEAQGPRPAPGHGDANSTFVEINKVVRSHLASIKKQCWEPAFAARGPDAPSSSKVVVSLSISPEGKVQSAEASGGDGFSGLASCVKTQASNLHFPASNEGAAVSVPFVFAAQ